MRISDWSSDVCSSDLDRQAVADLANRHIAFGEGKLRFGVSPALGDLGRRVSPRRLLHIGDGTAARARGRQDRSEEHTSELQSLMRISYAVFCLKKKKSK